MRGGTHDCECPVLKRDWFRGPVAAVTLVTLAAVVGLGLVLGYSNRDVSDKQGGLGSSAQRDQSQPIPNPTSAIVVIRDLQGFLEDCGCSGSDPGGLHRIPGVAGECDNVNYLLLGRSIIPPLSALRTDVRSLLPSHASGTVLALSRALRHLKNSYWIPDMEELQDLQSLGVSVEALSDFKQGQSTRIEGLPVRAGAELTIGGFTVPLPPVGSRARSVLVVSLWGTAAHGKLEYDRSLGSMYTASSSQSHSRDLPQHPVRKFDKFVLSHYFVAVGHNIAEDADVKALIGSGRVAQEHGGLKNTSEVAFSSVVLEKAWGSCGGCHPRAYSSWLGSRHSHAYHTLLVKGRDSNPVCLSCHVQEVAAPSRDSPLVLGRHQAVTCVSCHRRSVSGHGTQLIPAAEACSTCHTNDTDPQLKFVKHKSSVCPGDSIRNGAPCGMEEIPR